jgi:hypothetical protein
LPLQRNIGERVSTVDVLDHGGRTTNIGTCGTITEITEFGGQECYKVEFDDGNTWYISDEHLVAVGGIIANRTTYVRPPDEEPSCDICYSTMRQVDSINWCCKTEGCRGYGISIIAR